MVGEWTQEDLKAKMASKKYDLTKAGVREMIRTARLDTSLGEVATLVLGTIADKGPQTAEALAKTFTDNKDTSVLPGTSGKQFFNILKDLAYIEEV